MIKREREKQVNANDLQSGKTRSDTKGFHQFDKNQIFDPLLIFLLSPNEGIGDLISSDTKGFDHPASDQNQDIDI